MKFSLMLKQAAFACLFMTSGLSMALENEPEVTVDGLQLISETGVSRVYALPDINLARYNMIYLDDTFVAFKKNSQPGQDEPGSQKISAIEMARIKTELSSLFREIFSQTLKNNGYVLASKPAQNVLQIKPAIINLDIVSSAAEADNNGYSYTESAGEITLYLEFYDSLSGDIIGKAIDLDKDRQTGYFSWQNRINNRAAARRILQLWANILTQGLDQARSVDQVRRPVKND